jgi:hypothetical protein
MSLKNCKDCGKSVSDKSKFCVQCGRPNPTVEEKKPFSFLSRLEDIYELLKSTSSAQKCRFQGGIFRPRPYDEALSIASSPAGASSQSFCHATPEALGPK